MCQSQKQTLEQNNKWKQQHIWTCGSKYRYSCTAEGPEARVEAEEGTNKGTEAGAVEDAKPEAGADTEADADTEAGEARGRRRCRSRKHEKNSIIAVKKQYLIQHNDFQSHIE